MRNDDVGCATPDVIPAIGAALAVVVVAIALAIWAMRRLRPW